MHFYGLGLQVLLEVLFLALILFLHIIDETMGLFFLCVVTSQSSSIIPPAFLIYMTVDFAVFVYGCLISVALNEGTPDVLENSLKCTITLAVLTRC